MPEKDKQNEEVEQTIDTKKDVLEIDKDTEIYNTTEFKQVVKQLQNNIEAMIEIQKQVTDIDNIAQNNTIIQYNIDLYNLINNIQCWRNKDQQDDVNTLLTLLANCFEDMMILFLDATKTNPDLIYNFSFRYWDIKVHLDPKRDKYEVVKEIVNLIGTASELQDNQHLNTLDSCILIILAIEFLFDFKVDWDDFSYYYKHKIKSKLA